MEPIIEAAQALAGLLRTAEQVGLPVPYDASVNAHAPHGHAAVDEAPDFGHIGGIAILVRDDELSAWAEWLGSSLHPNAAPYKDNVHTHAYGMAGPIPVKVTALMPIQLTAVPATAVIS